MQTRPLRSLRSTLLCLTGSAAFMLLCRSLPFFSNLWLKLFLRPAGALLSRLSSLLPFPVLEPAVLLLCAWIAAALIRAAVRCAAGWRVKALWPALLLPLRIAAALLALYALLWYPAYWAADSAIPPASTDRLAPLCHTLIDRLNASAADFPAENEAFKIARSAVSAYTGAPLPDRAVKTARYPEWMDAFDLYGLYSPWTGEALVNPNTPAASLIFTACHELMHLQGVADEGQANIAAWVACQRAGGQAAASANLWALRYAMTALRADDEEAWRACTQRMNYALVEAFSSINGFAPCAKPDPTLLQRLLGAAGLGDFTDSYANLAGWLAEELEISP